MKHIAPVVPASPTALPSDAIRPSLGRRLWYYWFCVEAFLSTIPFSIAQLVSHQFEPTARNFKRCATGWGRTVLRLAGIRTRFHQRVPLDPTKPYVFVANHQNLLDILALSDAVPYPFGFIAKAELERVPFLGFAVRNSASLFIDRSEPRRMVETLKAAGERIRNGNSVLVFAEGARSYTSELLPLKKGAFAIAVEAGVPLVPVTLLDAYRLMDERRHLVRPGTIHVVLGEPISLEGMTRRDIPRLMERVRECFEVELEGVRG